MLRRCLFVGALLGAVIHSGDLRAAIIASDSFETYTAGATVNGNNGGTGFTGAYVVPGANQATVTVVNQSLSYNAGTVSVNGGTQAVQVTGVNDGSPLIARALSTQTGQPIYFSFLYQASATDEAFLQFGLANTTTSSAEPNASVGVAGNPSGPEGFFARIPNAGTSNFGSSTPAYAQLVAGQTYFLVAKVSGNGANYNKVELFLNPTSATEGTTTFASTGTGAASFNSFFLRTARTDATTNYLFDALTIGTTFADVVPTSAIPEPSLLALLAVPFAGWLWRRQRATS